MSHVITLRRAMSALGLMLAGAASAHAQLFPVQQEYQPTAAHILNAQPSDGPFLPARPNEPPATGQYTEPEFVPYVNDLQMFDQPDLSAYGRGPRPAEGWFGSAEVITWAISTPPKSTIGAPGAVRVWQPGAQTNDTGDIEPNQAVAGNGYTGTAPSGVNAQPNFDPVLGGVFQSSSYDSGWLDAQFTTGSRFEFGRINDGRGWIVSTFHLGAQTQVQESTKVAINFENQPIGWAGTVNEITGVFTFLDIDGDGAIGPLGIDRSNPRNGTVDPLPIDSEGIDPDFDDAVRVPTVFEYVRFENRTALWGVETMRMWRPAIGPRGGVWELFLGPRYLSVKDTFLIDARSTDDSSNSVPLPFYNMYNNTDVENNIFGLQLGGRWAIQRDRWQLSVETRGLAAVNFQNAKIMGKIDNESTWQNQNNTFITLGGSGVINGQLPHAYSSSASDVLFSPGGEFRTNLKYQMFRSVYLQLGYTGLFVSNVGRATNMTRYTFPSMVLNETNNRDFFFAQGVDFGVVINR